MVNTNYYGNYKRSEIDLRQEMERLLDGQHPEITKKQVAVLRKFRRNTSGAKIPCSCVDLVTHEPDKADFCPFCWGEGWLFDEVFVDIFKVVLLGDVKNATREEYIKPITANIPIYKFYLRYY
jgi:hypothetical protein